jgi:hypothetical protein
MPDAWLTGRTDLQHEVGFTTRANVEVGEELVLYAIPQRKIVGIAEHRDHTGEPTCARQGQVDAALSPHSFGPKALASFRRDPLGRYFLK